MKIPRLQSGPLCYTLEEWGLRTSIGQWALFITLSGLFFWIDTTIDDTEEGAIAGRAVCLTIAIISIIPILFSMMLFVGLLMKNIKILSIWIVYAVFGTTFISGLLVCSSFWYISISVGGGFLLLGVSVLLGGYMFYTVLIIYSIKMNIQDKNVADANMNIDVAENTELNMS